MAAKEKISWTVWFTQVSCNSEGIKIASSAKNPQKPEESESKFLVPKILSFIPMRATSDHWNAYLRTSLRATHQALRAFWNSNNASKQEGTQKTS